MENNFDNELTDLKRAEEERRAEITMMYIFMDRYPKQAQERCRKTAQTGERKALKSIAFSGIKT